MKKQKISFFATILTVLLAFSMASCSDVSVTLPLGPQGDQGISAYEAWKIKVINGSVNWPKDQITVTDYFKFLKGKDGQDGKSAYEVWKAQIAEGNVPNPHKPGTFWNPEDNTLAHFWKYLTGGTGENGKTPYIGANGNWFIDGTDTGLPARGNKGKDGKDAEPPKITIGANGNWFVNGVDTGLPSRGKDGKDGKTPAVTIGDNGNWFLDGVDTGKPARGADGHSPQIAIGQNGNWWVDGVDTGKPAFGTNGKDGKSAYELWKEEASTGNLPDPHNPGSMWDKDKVSLADFWHYLRGVDGKDGKSAYDLWKESVLNGTITNWPTNAVTLMDYFKYLKGKDGKDGKSAYEVWKGQIAEGNVPDPHNPGSVWSPNKNTLADFWKFLTGGTGESGQTPHIGANGNWFIGTYDTGVPARGVNGKDGKDAVPPVVTIGANGNWYVDGVDSGLPSRGPKGDNGHTPEVTIGNNGNWWIDGVDTGKPALGVDGKSPEVIIGNNGNWWIDGKDTGKPAFGRDGKDGKDGKSAYELWKEEVDAGCAGTGPKVKYPHDATKDWPCGMTSQTNFWQYLTGKDGKNAVIEIITGKFNVIPQYYSATLSEYVNPVDGSVKFRVFDKSGNPAPVNSTVKGMPGVTDQNHVFTTDAQGYIIVPRNLLPDKLPLANRFGETAAVTINGVTEKSAKSTIVPNRVNTRIVIESARLSGSADYNAIDAIHYWTTITYVYQRQVDGKWSKYPLATLPQPEVGIAQVKDVTQPLDTPNVVYEQATHQKWFYNHLYASGTVRIYRPQVLRAGEAAHASTSAKLKALEWNKKDNYWALVGLQNFYGEQPTSLGAIHVPEINPFPSFVDGVKYQVETGVTHLWGEVKFEDLSYCYEENLVEDGNLWKAQKQEASALPADYRVKVASASSNNGSTLLAVTYAKKSNKRFHLSGVYPGADIYVASAEAQKRYRAVLYYRFVKENNRYYLLDILSGQKKEIAEGTMPPNYLN